MRETLSCPIVLLTCFHLSVAYGCTRLSSERRTNLGGLDGDKLETGQTGAGAEWVEGETPVEAQHRELSKVVQEPTVANV